MRRLLLSVCVVLIAGQSARAQAKKEPLVHQVKNSIDRGVKYMRQNQRDDGGWERDLSSGVMYGGWTTLAVLSLLNAGVPVDDPMVAKGLRFIRKLEPTHNYVRALQTMVYAEANLPEDRERIQQNVKWLIDARVYRNGQFIGWSYTKGAVGTSDNSNSQYSLLGLWAARQAGIEIKREHWQEIRAFYIRDQQDSGGFIYSPTNGPAGHNRESLTMTTAGLCGLIIAGMELNAGREELLDDGTAKNCGAYPETTPAVKALSWVSDNFRVDLPQRVFYNLYGLERAGRLTGQRFFGQFDWYREGCQYLVRVQRSDGGWTAAGAWDQFPVVSTSFALLFLSKGRTPVLMSKLVHGDWGPRGRNERDLDWNNDRNDLRHLVDFAGKKMFKNLPLAWQSFDLMRAAAPKPGGDNLTEDDLNEVTSDMLQSPIFYITGHLSPRTRLRAIEKELLKRYVENGGFILAEACCGSAEFDQGFKALAAELWPDNDLSYLDEKHPVWKSFFAVSPGKPHKLMGVSMGCKTVVIYSPQDLSCRWESNKLDDGNVLRAFQLGANIIAYATGLEPPRPRLFQVNVAGGKGDPRQIPRGYFKVAQLKHRGDWQPAPRAMRNLMDHVNKEAGLDVVLKTEALQIDNSSLVDFKFLYMHGRGKFAIDSDYLKHLRFSLQSGGLLFADACCGKEAFDQSFRAMVEQLFPDKKLEEVALDDELFSKELNGVALTEENIKCRREAGKEARPMPPLLEGIKINNRWVVLYSKYDIGCALERHSSSECLGYTPDSALRLGAAAVLYTLRP